MVRVTRNLWSCTRIIWVILITYIRSLWHPNPIEYQVKSLKRLGPSFVKLGQTLSVRPDIVGVKYAKALSKLQDKLPAFSGDVAKNIVQSELGMPIEEVFAEFSSQAIAAASIAQVHKAVTHQGDVVAVKVMRPYIRKQFERDIELLRGCASFLSYFPRYRRLKPREVVETFADSAKKELDMHMEAASASQLKENTIHDEGFYVPKVFWKWTTSSVLTMEWVDGIPIGQIDALKEAGHDLEAISRVLAISFFNQAYRDGFFHADIHPGNLFVNAQSQIVPVDFGIMGSFDRATRIYVAEILRGFLNADYMHVAKMHFDAGYIPKNQSIHDFALACRAIGEPIRGLSVGEISVGKLLTLLFKITESFQMETQPQLLLFQKNLVLVEGVGGALYPQVNMWKLAEPWIEEWAKHNITPKAKAKHMIDEFKEFARFMPERMHQIGAMLDKYEVLSNAQLTQKKATKSVLWWITAILALQTVTVMSVLL